MHEGTRAHFFLVAAVEVPISVETKSQHTIMTKRGAESVCSGCGNSWPCVGDDTHEPCIKKMKISTDDMMPYRSSKSKNGSSSSSKCHRKKRVFDSSPVVVDMVRSVEEVPPVKSMKCDCDSEKISSMEDTIIFLTTEMRHMKRKVKKLESESIHVSRLEQKVKKLVIFLMEKFPSSDTEEYSAAE